MFHSRSKDTSPGAGVGESISAPPSRYADLAEIVHWRRRLSNFDEAPFSLDGLRWRSVEHFFQAQKFIALAPPLYRSFSIDSGSPLSHALGGPVKRAGGRRAMPLDEAARAWWEETKHDEMERALTAKYEQNPHHQRILLATHLAKLTHKPARSRHTHTEHALMQTRQRLS